MLMAVAVALCATTASTQSTPPLTTVEVIEYYDAGLDHYFITADPVEIYILDAGILQGWVRTGYEFPAYSTDSVGAGWSPVCRLYGLTASGLDSHFYSASPAECAAVLARFASSWVLESSDVFQV